MTFALGSDSEMGGTWHNNEGNRQACYVWWNDTERKANLNWVENFDSTNDWFVFSRYSLRSPVCSDGSLFLHNLR